MNKLQKKIFQLMYPEYKYGTTTGARESKMINKAEVISKFLIEEIKNAMIYARLKDSKNLEETIDDYLCNIEN